MNVTAYDPRTGGGGTQTRQSASIAPISIAALDGCLTFKRRAGPDEQNKQSARSQFAATPGCRL